MNYCSVDKKCHKNDLLLPPRGVYLELHREIYETRGNRQHVNGVWEALLPSAGTSVDEEQVKMMKNGSAFSTMFKDTSQAPREGFVQLPHTNPPAQLHWKHHALDPEQFSKDPALGLRCFLNITSTHRVTRKGKNCDQWHSLESIGWPEDNAVLPALLHLLTHVRAANTQLALGFQQSLISTCQPTVKQTPCPWTSAHSWSTGCE